MVSSAVMDPAATETLLRRWQDQGDEEALGRLLELHMDWIEEEVRSRLGPALRARAQTLDLVQQTALEFLRYVPKADLSDGQHFRALLVRIAENVIRGEADRARAARRDVGRECRLATGAPLEAGTKSPSEKAADAEMAILVERGLESLAGDDRWTLLARDQEKRDFRSIGEALGVSEDAARMRYHRALARLGAAVRGIEEADPPGARSAREPAR